MNAPRSRSGGHRAALCLLASMAVATTMPLGAVTAQETEQTRLLRQLEVFERLLAETVQLHISEQIEPTAMQNVMIEVGEGGVLEMDSAPVVRVGSINMPHGVYVAGHGLVFSFESPQVAVMPRPLALRLERPFGMYEVRGVDGDVEWAGKVVEFRTGMIQESLAELEALLERERAGAADPERTAELLEEIENLRRNLEALQAKVAEAPAVDAEAPVEIESSTAPDRRQARVKHRVAAPDVFEFYRGVVADQKVLVEDVVEQRGRVSRAVREACIEALSQYGGVIKGLGDEDRITILVQPADAWGRRSAIPENGEEVISVRYRDIRDLDAGKIDHAGFRSRVVVNDRLGNAIAIEQQ